MTNIETIISRIDNYNEKRIKRALGLMHPLARQVFHLIPALFHCDVSALKKNHCPPAPFGLSQFKWLAEHQQLLESFEIAFAPPESCDLVSNALSPTNYETALPQDLYPKEPGFHDSNANPIHALYAMGSTGSLGQSALSDLDIWVCISSEMSCQDRQKLDHKCQQITDWAIGFDVEANFFLMDEKRFVDTFSESLSGENCGSSQHILLLDEFYRSAVRLAGKRLLWQVLPGLDEESYQDHIETLMAAGEDLAQWVDFGPIRKMPADECFGANLWQLYKSIDSPYKSVLKAILLEAYSSEYPSTQMLSFEVKKRLSLDSLDCDRLDPYFLMLEKVTTYLERNEDWERLELIRRCFYIKTDEQLSKPPTQLSMPWRRQLLNNFVQQWQWSDEDIAHLDNRRGWKVEQTQIMHHQLLDALMKSYNELIQFARKNLIASVISPQDISILARKLYAAFEELPEKVTLLNTQISPDLHEDTLTFVQVTPNEVNLEGWYLYKQAPIAPEIISKKPLLHNNYLSKLVAWGFFNGLITESSRFYCSEKQSQVSIDKLYQMVGDLRNSFSLFKRRPKMQALAKPCEINQLAVFVNFEQDATADLCRNEVKNKSDWRAIDVMNFGDEQKMLISSIDFVYRNSWYEVRTMNFTGELALLNSLKSILGKMHQNADRPASIDVFCYSKHFKGLIRNKVFQLISDCIDLRLQASDSENKTKFKPIQIGQQMFGLFFERRGVSVKPLENSVDFYRLISGNKLNCLMGAKHRTLHSELVLPHEIDAFASEGLIQFFFEDNEKGFDLYVLDEANHAEVYPNVDKEKDEFINSVNEYYSSSLCTANNKMTNFNLPQYYQLIRACNGELQVHPYASNMNHSTIRSAS